MRRDKMKIKSKNWFSKQLRSFIPKREALARNPYMEPIAHRFLSPELWRFTRRSVPRGVALGLFAAFIVPIGQIFLAAFLAPFARANMPLAAAVTFVTNPFTLPFWLVVANRVGNFTLAIDAATTGVANEGLESGQFAWLAELWQLAGVTAFGFVVLAVLSASLGYLLSVWVWRLKVSRRRRKQKFPLTKKR